MLGTLKYLPVLLKTKRFCTNITNASFPSMSSAYTEQFLSSLTPSNKWKVVLDDKLIQVVTT